MKKNTRLPALPALGLALLALTGCAGVPADKSAADWLHILPDDSTYYLCLNTGRSKDLALAVLKGTPYWSPDVGQLISFTDRVFCGIKLKAGQKPSFYLALLGGYPLIIKSVFDGSADWEAHKGDAPEAALRDTPYWRHKKFGLQAALPAPYLVVMAQEGVEELIRSAAAGGSFALSHAVLKEMEANDLTLLFPLGLNELITADLGLPVNKRIFEEIWFGARLKDDQYNFAGVFNVGPEVDPQSFKKLLQFFFLALLRRNNVEGTGERLSEMTFLVEERMIKVSNLNLAKKELERLVSGLLAKGL